MSRFFFLFTICQCFSGLIFALEQSDERRALRTIRYPTPWPISRPTVRPTIVSWYSYFYTKNIYPWTRRWLYVIDSVQKPIVPKPSSQPTVQVRHREKYIYYTQLQYIITPFRMLIIYTYFVSFITAHFTGIFLWVFLFLSTFLVNNLYNPAIKTTVKTANFDAEYSNVAADD
jgi:hypothetical protein